MERREEKRRGVLADKKEKILTERRKENWKRGEEGGRAEEGRRVLADKKIFTEKKKRKLEERRDPSR